jgi:uncharacterized protein
VALAVECFRQAAEMEYTIGQHYLGECNLLGLGTETDVDEAAAWFERVAATGIAMSQRYLGIISSGKKGPSSIPVDHKRAFELFADAGYGLAQADLASVYDSCLGVAPLLELSIFWDSKAAMQGVVSARRDLAASYYRRGLDDKFVPATAPIALFWARKAAAGDDPHVTR